MKRFFFGSLLSLTLMGARAQNDKPLTFGIGVEAAFPIGNFINSSYNKFNDIYAFGIGGNVQGKYRAAGSIGITVNVGFMTYSPKSFNGIKGYSLGVIPILAGIEYDFTPKLFGTGQLGYSIYTGELVSDLDADMGGFSYAPGIGYRFSDHFNAALKYQGTAVTLKYSNTEESGNISQIGIRVAYVF